MAQQEVPANLDHVQANPRFSSSEAAKAQKRNVASLKRKITYHRNGRALQYQRVEGWTGRQVLAYMIAGGVTRAAIDKAFRVRGL